MSNQSTISTIVNIFAAPNEAFQAIKARATFFVPLLLVCLGAFAVNWLYTAAVDIIWLTEQQLRAQAFRDFTDAEIEQLANVAADRAPTMNIVFSVLGAISECGLVTAAAVVFAPIIVIAAFVLALI